MFLENHPLFQHAKNLCEEESTPFHKVKGTQKRLACIVIEFILIGLFCLPIHFVQTWLQKLYDFGQTQNQLDQNKRPQ
jgi:hypothetical protein